MWEGGRVIGRETPSGFISGSYFEVIAKGGGGSYRTKPGVVDSSSYTHKGHKERRYKVKNLGVQKTKWGEQYVYEINGQRYAFDHPLPQNSIPEFQLKNILRSQGYEVETTSEGIKATKPNQQEQQQATHKNQMALQAQIGGALVTGEARVESYYPPPDRIIERLQLQQRAEEQRRAEIERKAMRYLGTGAALRGPLGPFGDILPAAFLGYRALSGGKAERKESLDVLKSEMKILGQIAASAAGGYVLGGALGTLAGLGSKGREFSRVVGIGIGAVGAGFTGYESYQAVKKGRPELAVLYFSELGLAGAAGARGFEKAEKALIDIARGKDTPDALPGLMVIRPQLVQLEKSDKEIVIAPLPERITSRSNNDALYQQVLKKLYEEGEPGIIKRGDRYYHIEELGPLGKHELPVIEKPSKVPALPIIAPWPQSKISQEITQSAKTETILFQQDQKLQSKHAVKERIFFFPAIEPQQKTSQKSNNDSSSDLSISYTPDFDIFTPPKPTKETFKPRPRKTEKIPPSGALRPPGGLIPPFFLFIPPGGPKRKPTTPRKPINKKVKFPRFVPVLNPIFIFWGKYAGGVMQKVGGKLRPFSEKDGEHAPGFPVHRQPTPLDFPLNFIIGSNRKKKNKKEVRAWKQKLFPFL